MVSKADDPDALLRLRSRLPADLALVPLIESAAGLVHALELAQVPGVTRLAFGAIDFGFSGKLCIHPAQIAAVSAAFTPTKAEVAWALSVVGTEGGAIQVAGKMIDRPVTERAKRILQQVKRGSSNG